MASRIDRQGMSGRYESGLGRLLRRHRDAVGLTQEELAERAGISSRAVSDIERGTRRLIYRDTAGRLTKALQLGPEECAEFEAAARGRVAAQAVDITERGTVPVPPTGLIGRDSEVARLAGQLLEADARVISLVGPGGVGKTRLALEVCQRTGNAFEDGVCFVSLGDIRDARLVLPAIASALKARSAGDRLTSAVGAHLRGKRLLLVLDTLEHVLEAAPDIAEIAGLAPSVRFLATSRSPLRIRGEQQFTVSPLSPGAAFALFEERAHAVSDSQLLEDSRPVVQEICKRLDGVPLAIELAAARVRHLPPAEILSHLERRFSILTGGPVDLPARQQTMAATVAWSYDLLGSAERRLLEALSVFAGGWSFESAAAVRPQDTSGGELLEILSRLVDSSLVLRDDRGGDTPRYRMLDVVRGYAADRLRERVDETGIEELHRRHAEHFLALSEAAEPHLTTSEHRAWIEGLSMEAGNLRVALNWTMTSRNGAMALQLTAALWMFWRTAGAFSEGRAWLEEALSMDPGGHVRERARVIWGAGWLAYQQGDIGATAARGAELLEWAQSVDDRVGARNGVTLLGQARLAESDYRAAADYFDQALEIARELGTGWLVATSLLNRSMPAIHMGETAQARAMLNEAREVYERLGDDRFTARATLQLSYLALLEGHVQEARDLTMGALEVVAGLGDRWAVAEQVQGLTAIHAAAGECEEAVRLAGAAESIWESIGAQPHPADRASTDRWLKPALERAGTAEMEIAMAEGRAMSLREAVRYALSLPDEPD
jgi:predicted ATPase/transcriptional regulator with XRE-family HTH domain